MKVIHSISDVGGPFKIKIGRDARSRCGIVASVVGSNVGPTRYEMLDAKGNDFLGTTRRGTVTCQKCINLLTVGTIHDKHAPPDRHTKN